MCFWDYNLGVHERVCCLCVCMCVSVRACRPLCLTIIDLVKGLKLLDGTCILRNVERFIFTSASV